MAEPVIRPARPGEAAALTALTMRAKAHWGYPPELLAGWGAELGLTEAYLADNPCHLLEAGSAPLGYYSLLRREDGARWSSALSGPDWWLDNLFVEPAAMGGGLGARLYLHALETARVLGAARLVLVSDIHAAGFYARMGAVELGEHPSPVHGYPLPVFQHELQGAVD